MKKETIPYDEVDVEIIPVLKAINRLKYCRTLFSCAGYGKSSEDESVIGHCVPHHAECGRAYICIEFSPEYVNINERLIKTNLFHKSIRYNDVWGWSRPLSREHDYIFSYYINFVVKNCIGCRIGNSKGCDAVAKNEFFGQYCYQEELPEKWEMIENLFLEMI